MKTKKILKSYRINPEIIKEMKEILKEINTTETSFVEMAIIEKMARIQAKKYEDYKMY